jgi:hypothetical protein
MPSAVDPVVRSFVEAVNHEDAATTTDTVGGLFLRLINRVGALEKTVEQQAVKLKQVDKLARQPRPVRNPPPVRLETGVDVYGDPVRIEHKIRRPRGRPKGARDRYPRRTGIVSPPPARHIVDPDWDRC